MYSVLRFCELSFPVTQQIGKNLDQVLPGSFEGFDRGCSNRVSIFIADDNNWNHHKISIMKKIEVLSELINMINKIGSMVELDIAIEPEDYSSLFSEYCFDNRFMCLIISHKINLTFSIYGKG